MKFGLNSIRPLLSCFILTLIALSALSVSAQDADANPLLKMLELVPASVAVSPDRGDILSYVDYRAAELSRGVSFERDAALLSADDETRRMWRNAMMRVNSGPSQLLEHMLVQIEQGMGDLVGFDRLAIDRALSYGVPPGMVMLIDVDYDADSIAAALGARDFEQRDVNGVTVWHRYDDFQINLASREPADPFNGQLGGAARVALLPSPSYLVYSASWPPVEAAIATAVDESESLADIPAYRTLAEAITVPGELVQAQFVRPADVAFMSPAGLMFLPNITQEAFEEMLALMQENLNADGELPLYNMAVLADHFVGEEEQVVSVALSYNSEAEAQAALDVLAARLIKFAPMSRGDQPPVAERFEAVLENPHVYVSEDGSAAAVVSLRYPLMGMDEDSGSFGLAPTPGNLFRVWMQSVYNLEFTPLAVAIG